MTLIRKKNLRSMSDRELGMQKEVTDARHRDEHENRRRIREEEKRRKVQSRSK